MYKVYFLDGYEITDVESVETTSARNITLHHGLGKGYFPIADDKDLKAWVVKCQQESTELFKVLDNLLKVQDESRLIVSSDTENFSELVYLESYTKVEQNAGVFDVTMKFIEYVPVSIKTTDIPYIKRPGKAPVETKTINGKKGIVVENPKELNEYMKKYYEQWGKDYVAYNNKMFGSDGKPIENLAQFDKETGKQLIIVDAYYEGSTSDRLTKEFIAKQKSEKAQKDIEKKKRQEEEKARQAMIKARYKAMEPK